MHTSTLAILISLSALVLALPTNDPSSTSASATARQGFSIPRIVTGRTKLKNGAAEMMKTYLKYTKTVPNNVMVAASNVSSGVGSIQSGSVTANPDMYNEEYASPVQIGTPPQTLMMDFDTGSSDFWVFSSRLPASDRVGHNYYNPANSSTKSRQTGETWSIIYGDGDGAKGIVFSDQVTIGGVTATLQAVEVATSVSADLISEMAIDGLVGLGFDTLNDCKPTPCQTFIDNVAPLLPSPIFAAYLKRGAIGAYDFGFLDSDHYQGEITYTPVTQKSYWTINTSGYSIGSGTEQTRTDESVVDTGTTLVFLPYMVVFSYYSNVTGSQNDPNAGGYTFPCSEASNLPDFTIYISGVGFTIPGANINYAPTDGSGVTCFGGLQSNAEIGMNILGDLFINNFYVVFDFESESAPSRVGFAVQS